MLNLANWFSPAFQFCNSVMHFIAIALQVQYLFFSETHVPVLDNKNY